MRIKQLQKLVMVKSRQHIKIINTRERRTIETNEGWDFEPDSNYEGYDADEIKKILDWTVDCIEFNSEVFEVWVH